MLNILNKSLTSIFAPTTRSNKMSSAEHKCLDNGCVGSKFAGCNIKCSRCLSPTFIECISDRTEIIILLKLMNVVADVTPSQSISTENMAKMNNESVIEFVCASCKAEGSFLDQKKKLNDKIKSLQKKTLI